MRGFAPKGPIRLCIPILLFLLASTLCAAPTSTAEPGVSATLAAQKLSARLLYDPLTGYGVIERAGFRVSFGKGVGMILVDWSSVRDVEPPIEGEGGLVFSAATFRVIEKAFSEDELMRRSHYSVAAILIDPGHGGKDPGAIGEHQINEKRLRVVEKDINLKLALSLYEALKKRYPERRILITREADQFPSLEERVEMANSVELASNEAIIYVSIHANASFNRNSRGFEVWYLNPDYRRTLVETGGTDGPGEDIAPILNAMLEEEFTTESIILARNILKGMQAAIGSESPNRGVRAEEWFVVRNARMPSVLIETGFVTNADEARLLSDGGYLKRLAEGIYNGIVDFIRYFESMRGSPQQ